ncbi:MAG TPA: hypothetical protein VFA00_00955 [Actinomycetota bacterium]|nr:hypothetical protein [Actinomycetota bacterium]
MRTSIGGRFGRFLVVLAALVMIAAACSDDGSDPAAESGAPSSDSSPPCYELGWKDCPEEPYPFSTPLPPAEPTAIDGTYSRTVDEELAAAPGKCTRCPPYRLVPGDETLTFDRGRFFVQHGPPGFKMSGHFWVEGGQIRLFNDPSCLTMEGVYEWEVAGGVLSLEAVEDECPFTRLRQRFLMAKDWEVTEGDTADANADASAECDPPSEEAAITGHWPVPEGCEDKGRS